MSETFVNIDKLTHLGNFRQRPYSNHRDILCKLHTQTLRPMYTFHNWVDMLPTTVICKQLAYISVKYWH